MLQLINGEKQQERKAKKNQQEKNDPFQEITAQLHAYEEGCSPRDARDSGE